jgi:hypothetical protein
VALAEVEREADPDGWEEPVSWRDAAADPSPSWPSLRPASARPRCTRRGGQYPLERCSLTDQADKDLDKLAMLGVEISDVRFGDDEHEQAQALGALHGALIVGQDVADQLACVCIARALKEARAHQRRGWERRRAPRARANGDGVTV